MIAAACATNVQDRWGRMIAGQPSYLYGNLEKVVNCNCRTPTTWTFVTLWSNSEVRNLDFLESEWTLLWPSKIQPKFDWLCDLGNLETLMLRKRTDRPSEMKDPRPIIVTERTDTDYRYTVPPTTANRLTASRPIVNRPTMNQPTVNRPTVYHTSIKQSTVNQHTVNRPTVYQPTVNWPTIYRSIANQPTGIDE